MKSHSLYMALAAVLLTALATPLLAAEPAGTNDCAKPDATTIVKCYAADIAMPDSPGLMIVGLGAENVLRPTTPRQFGAALAKGVNDDGKPASGFALDVAPYKVFAESTTRDEYAASAWRRALWNTQVSAGVGQSDDSKDKTLKVGYGISSVIWRSRQSDPLRNSVLKECLAKNLQPPPASSLGTFGSAPVALPSLDACYDEFDKTARNSTALTVGYAASEVSEDGIWGHRRKGPSGLWATFSYAPQRFAGSLEKFRPELSLQWRDLDRQRVEDPAQAGTFVDQSSTLYGVVARFHGQRTNFVAERNWLRKKLPGVASDRSNKFGVGIEFRVLEDTWIVVAFGGEDALSGNGDETHFRTGIKFGKSEQSLFSAN